MLTPYGERTRHFMRGKLVVICLTYSEKSKSWLPFCMKHAFVPCLTYKSNSNALVSLIWDQQLRIQCFKFERIVRLKITLSHSKLSFFLHTYRDSERQWIQTMKMNGDRLKKNDKSNIFLLKSYNSAVWWTEQNCHSLKIPIEKCDLFSEMVQKHVFDN